MRFVLNCLVAFAIPGAEFVFAQTTEPASRPAATQPVASQPARAQSAAAVLAAAHIAGVTADMSLEDVLRRGRDALRVDDPSHSYENASRIFYEVLQEDPQNVTAMLGIANAYDAQAKQVADSSDPDLKKHAPELRNAAIVWFKRLGNLSSARGDYATAERSYQNVLRLAPADYEAQYGLAHGYMISSRDMNAIEQYGELLRNPATPADIKAKGYLEKGQTCRRGRLTAQALDAFDKALKLDPENAEIYHEMARTYMERGELPKARKAIERAIVKAQTRPDFRETDAQIFLEEKDYPKAVFEAGEAIKYGMGLFAQNREDRNLARSLYQYYETYKKVAAAVLTQDPSNTLLRNSLTEAIRQQSDVSQALALFECLNVLNSAPPSERNNPRLLEQFVRILRLLQSPHTQGIAQKLLAIEPNNSLALEALRSSASQPATSSAPG